MEVIESKEGQGPNRWGGVTPGVSPLPQPTIRHVSTVTLHDPLVRTIDMYLVEQDWCERDFSRSPLRSLTITIPTRTALRRDFGTDTPNHSSLWGHVSSLPRQGPYSHSYTWPTPSSWSSTATRVDGPSGVEEWPVPDPDTERGTGLTSWSSDTLPSLAQWFGKHGVGSWDLMSF